MPDPVEIPATPAGLGERGTRLWERMCQEFDFSRDPFRLEILEDACREVDLIGKLQGRIDELGDDLRVLGSMGQPVSAPEIAEIRAHRSLLATLLARLNLPELPEVEEVLREATRAKRRESSREYRRRGKLHVVGG